MCRAGIPGFRKALPVAPEQAHTCQIGGLAIGILENLMGGYLDIYFGGGVKEVAPFIVLVIILMIKPYGLFGTVEIERV